MSNLHILLLAAGASSRMKRSKPLLPWKNDTLINHQVNTLLATSYPLTVVLGAKAQDILPTLKDLNISTIVNEHWEEGMGNSLAYGVQAILKASPNVQGILVALVDQPLLTTAHYKRILNTFTPDQKQLIVSATDQGVTGPPVLFDAFYFNELTQLTGDEGAKVVTKKHKEQAVRIPMGSALQDVDTPEEFERLRSDRE